MAKAKQKYCGFCGANVTRTKGVCKKCNSTPKYSRNGFIDRKTLKNDAKEMLVGNMWNIWKPFLIILLITLFFTFSMLIFTEIESIFGTIANLVFTMVAIPLSVGFSYYMLKLVRGGKPVLMDLFDFYDKRAITILVLTLLVGILTLAWSILFIIPGVIAAVSYSMVYYIYADGFNGDAIGVVSESRRITKGYIMDFIGFEFGFLGWILLSIISFGIAFIYVFPYMSIANTLYYDELRKINLD